MTLRNSYLSVFLLIVLIALHACTQENTIPTKKTDKHPQKQQIIAQKAPVSGKKIDIDASSKFKYTKPVPIVVIPVEPFPEPLPEPEPYPEPYPFPEPPVIPAPKQLQEPKQEQILDIATVQPEFPGGTEALMTFIQANMQYPELERELGIEGKVYVGFAVMKSGEITNVKIMRGIKDAPNFDKEALRIVKLMPLWIPGMNNGQTVNVRTIVPIRFSLN